MTAATATRLSFAETLDRRAARYAQRGMDPRTARFRALAYYLAREGRHSHRPQPPVPGLIREFVCEGEDSSVRYWLFEGSASDLEAVRKALAAVTDLDGWSTGCTYDCSGRTFAWPVSIKRVGPQRILARQRVFLDV